MDNLEFSAQAITKMAMHAMKHPHSICTGLLLSPKPSEDIGQEDGDVRKVKIIEAIPISHVSQYLTPNYEIAYNSIKVFAQEQELVISGFYQADQDEEKSCPDEFVQRIVQKISENFPKPILCFVSLHSDKAEPSFKPLQLNNGKWLTKSPQTHSYETEISLITEHILFSKEKLYRKIMDFDDHFDDISVDWTNAKISQKVDYLIANVC